jgi:ABC-type glycerol-3-phosphate transport system substrate-binding protein
MVFVAIVATCFLIVLIGVLMLSGAGKKDEGKGFKPKTKEVVIWSVNMPATLFEALNKGFNDYVDRSDMKLKVRDFSSYEDLLDVFPRVVQAGASPDIVLIPNHGGHMYLDPITVSLGENIIDLDDFENRFHPLFVDELVFEEKQKVDGVDQVVRGVRGVPVGFEPLGIYYNRELMPTTPQFWENIMELLSEDAKTNKVPAVSLGYGRATPISADIFPFLTMQYKGEKFNSYETIDSVEARSTLETLLEYRIEPNNLSQFRDAYVNTLTNTDLFVRGKVATLVGYPSTERDILLAIKRAKKDKAYDDKFEKNVRWTTIPQVEEEVKKQINMARYMYFVMAKFGINRNKEKPSNDPVIKFMQYLATAKAQETFFENYEYYLPSQIEMLKETKSQIDGKTGEFDMTVGDWYVPTQKYVTYNKWLPHLFTYIVEKALDEPGATASVISSNILSYLSCKINHLRDPDTYDVPCECRVDTQQNNNHYWPVCQWWV